MLDQFLWCVILGGIFCFTLGFGIGANDVSNNFGTSVGSKSISLRSAIVIAAIFEFIGSVGFGATVTDSLRKGIYYPEKFTEIPEVLLLANLCALMSGTFWLLFACSYGLPVSTSHSLIGAMMGCGLAISASTAVNYNYMMTVMISWFLSPLLSCMISMIYFGLIRKYLLRNKNSIKLGKKILWILILLLCLIFSFFFIYSNPMTIKSISCDMIDNNNTSIIIHSSPCHIRLWSRAHKFLSSLISIFTAIILTLILAPFCYWKANRNLQKFESGLNHEQGNIINNTNQQQQLAPATHNHDHGHDHGHDHDVMVAAVPNLEVIPPPPPTSTITESNKLLNVQQNPWQGFCLNLDDTDVVHQGHVSSNSSSSASAKSCRRSVASTQASDLPETPAQPQKGKIGTWERMPWNHDLHADAFREDAHAEELSTLAERFDPRAECFFTTLQIISASVACLVHGSNDVSNAAAPYTSVYSIYKEGKFLPSVTVPLWILILGGAAISVGLTFLGHRVIKRVGIRLLHISPSRGFCIEMAMGTVMTAGSFLGLPLSTTHVAVGAMVGVGLIDRHIDPLTGAIRRPRNWINLDAINWRVVSTIAVAWVGTLVVCAAVSCALFSFAAFSPSLSD